MSKDKGDGIDACASKSVSKKASVCFLSKDYFMKKTVLTLSAAAIFAAAAFAQGAGFSAETLNSQTAAETLSENADDQTLSAQEISKSIENVDGIKIFAEVLKSSSEKISDIASETGVTVLAPIDTVADTGRISQNIADYIVPEKLTKESLESKTSVKAVSGKELPVEVKDSEILINNVAVAGLSDSSDENVSVLRLSSNFTETSVALSK